MKIVVCDDHHLFRQGLRSMIGLLGAEYKVTGEAANGDQLLELIKTGIKIDIAIVDLNMPVKNGFETTKQLKLRYPDIKILIVTMDDHELSMIKLMRLGVNGFIGKDSSPTELKSALLSIASGGHYFSETTHATHEPPTKMSFDSDPELNQTEMRILELSATELTYKEIADKMYLSPKTIDNYRAAIFEKLGVRSRVGAVMYGLKRGWIRIQ